MNRINLVTGDQSGDGHDKRQSFYIDCNLTTLELATAYEAGAKIAGWSLVTDIAADYDENTMTREQLKRLTDLGYEFGLEGEDWADEDDDVQVSAFEFPHLYMFFAWLGNNNVVWEELDNNVCQLHIGGYGFWS